MKRIKAIRTRYAGFLFRSLLEARWAVFFDALGIEWQYEPQGFELSTGEWYLPDFRLPTFDGGLWCEVKFAGGDFHKAHQFFADSRQRIWLCEGPPDYAIYYVTHEEGSNCCGIPNYNEAQGENRMYVAPCELCHGPCDVNEAKRRALVKQDDFLWADRGNVARAIHIAQEAQFRDGQVIEIEEDIKISQ